jgi:LCP family protein required for cell wall assembly
MMKLRTIVIFSLLLLVLSACNFPALTTQRPASGNGLPVSYRLATPDPNATATPTPFRPQDAAGVVPPTSDVTAAPGSSATPSASHTVTATPFKIPRPDGQVNILLLGSDFRPNSGYRTDVMMWVALNTRQGTASVISFPRDLYVNIPGWMYQRLNTAQAHGGFELMQDTFETNFGIRPDHYVMTNMNGFKGIINTLGGIRIYSSIGLYDKCDLPQKSSDGYCSMGPGWVDLNADEALWYVRSRYSSSDFDRLRRAQEVVMGIFTKLLNLNALQRGPELYNLFRSSVETDMSVTDVIALLPMAASLSSGDNIRRYAVTYEMTDSIVVEGQGQVQAPHVEEIMAMLREALAAP